MYNETPTASTGVMSDEQAALANSASARRSRYVNIFRLTTALTLITSLLLTSKFQPGYCIVALVLMWARPVRLSQIEQEILRYGWPLSERQFSDLLLLNACAFFILKQCYTLAPTLPFFALSTISISASLALSFLTWKESNILGNLIRKQDPQ
jgi:hypothetical protein